LPENSTFAPNYLPNQVSNYKLKAKVHKPSIWKLNDLQSEVRKNISKLSLRTKESRNKAVKQTASHGDPLLKIADSMKTSQDPALVKYRLELQGRGSVSV
jgi:hypothetical protein